MTGKGTLRLRVDTPATVQVWEEIYRADAQALPTQSPAWAAAITASGAYGDASRLYTFEDGARAVVPLFETKAAIPALRRSWSQPPAWGFGGLIATRPPSTDELAAVLADLAATAPLQIQLRPNPLDAARWQSAAADWTRLGRTAHVLDLSGGFEEVCANRLKPRTRTTIRKAEAAGMEIESGNGPALIEAFYGLLQLSFDRWAKRQHEPRALARWRARGRDPVQKFHQMARALGPGFTIWLARHGGEPVAAILVLQGHNAHYTRGAMNEELAAPLSANFLLHYQAIRAACAAGCRSYQMGETGNSASLAQFKSRFGAVAVPYAEYLHERVPLHWLGTGARTLAKKALRFRDA